MVVILRRLSSSSSSSLSFIIQRRDDEKRERERVCINTKEYERKQFQSVAYFSVSCCLKQTSFALIFFRERICSHKQQKKKNNTNTHRTIAFRRDNIIHFTRKSNQNQSCLRSTTRW